MVYFQPQNPNLGKFGRVLQWKMSAYLWTSGIFNGHFVHCLSIMYILRSLGIFFSVLVCCTNKNLATLAHSECGRNVTGAILRKRPFLPFKWGWIQIASLCIQWRKLNRECATRSASAASAAERDSTSGSRLTDINNGHKNGCTTCQN
jgi:hypothetical protein